MQNNFVKSDFTKVISLLKKKKSIQLNLRMLKNLSKNGQNG